MVADDLVMLENQQPWYSYDNECHRMYNIGHYVILFSDVHNFDLQIFIMFIVSRKFIIL